MSPEAYKRWTRVRCLDNFGRLSAVQGPPPDLPQGGSDVNCVPAQAVGPVDVGAATVVTLSQHALKSESGRIYRESDVEQLWPTSNGERDTVVHRAYVDALLRTYRGTRSTTAEETLGGGVKASGFKVSARRAVQRHWQRTDRRP